MKTLNVTRYKYLSKIVKQRKICLSAQLNIKVKSVHLDFASVLCWFSGNIFIFQLSR